MEQIDTDIAIVGAGLSGLTLARELARRGRAVCVLEARERIGGRILSPTDEKGDALPYDMGPAWIWPHNSGLLRLLSDLTIGTFPQFAEGKLAFEDPSGNVRRDLDFAPMAGSLRVVGGLDRVVRALADGLPPDTIRTGHAATGIHWADSVKTVSGVGPKGAFSVRAEHIVLAVPPRVLARDVTFSPALPGDLISAFRLVPTWMAGHAKLIAIYDRPFWRDMGLSGDAISHRGPLAEIHDASPADSTTGALFGFFGLAADARRRAGEGLIPAALEQLQNLFGTGASGPKQVLLQDWADEVRTTVEADLTPPAGHPDYRRPAALDRLSVHGLQFAGTELAPVEGGFLEGAVAAAHLALSGIVSGTGSVGSPDVATHADPR
ncbi:MAG: NAD(P)/FAD-dependent oxidoreductase [Pseudomonadota bacterium]